jgi:cytochrome c biogenesis protein
MNAPRPETSPRLLDSLWTFFASIRLTVIVLITMAALSIIGTLIPQNKSPVEYFEAFGPFFYQLLATLDIFDMYHSWWFQALIIILAINIIVCSIDRLRKTWRIIFPAVPSLNLELFRHRKSRLDFEVSASASELEAPYKVRVEKFFGGSRLESQDAGYVITADKGRWTRLGVYGVHFGVVVLLIGSLVGSMTGFDGYVNIPEGESTSTIQLRNTGGTMVLPFAIRCDSFQVLYYEGGRRPKEYRSSLTILEDGRPVLQKDIIVNDPLHYKGIAIYQSSFGKADSGMAPPVPAQAPEKIDMVFRSAASGMLYNRSLEIGQPIELPEALGRFILTEYQASAEFKGMSLGPIFLGVLTPREGEPEKIMLPWNFPKFDSMRQGNVVISVSDPPPQPETRYFTGLQVNSDPGVPLVYTGFILIVAGCMVAFFMSHQSVVIEVQPGASGSYIMVSGTSNKGKYAFRQKLDRLADALKESAARN